MVQSKNFEVSGSIQHMKLKDLSSILQGNQFRSKLEITPEGDSFVVQMKNILSNKTIDYQNLPKINSVGINKKFFIKQGDILLVNRGGSIYSALVDKDVTSTIAAGHFFILRANFSQIIPSFLNSFLNQTPGQKLLKQCQTGTTMLMLSRKEIENIVIPVPPIKVQEKLAKLYELQIRESDLMQQITKKRRIFFNSIFISKLKNV